MTANVCMTEATIKDALDKLRGAVMIVYPMNLPPHDPIRLEFEGNEDLTGTQVIPSNARNSQQNLLGHFVHTKNISMKFCMQFCPRHCICPDK